MSEPSLLAFVAAAFVLGDRALGQVAIPVLFSNAWRAWETRVPARELPALGAAHGRAGGHTTFIRMRLTLGLSERCSGR